MTASSQARPNPYVGPRAFQRGETLYGRDREMMELLDLLIAERIVLLYSPSGAGKTSLIQAALIPELEAEGFRVLPAMRVNLEPPQDGQVSSAANRYVLSLLLSLEEALPAEQQTPLAELADVTLADYLDRRPRVADEPDSEVLIFDQFEEILTVDPTDRAAKAAFFAQVGTALRNRQLWALFVMREEFIAGLDPYLRPMPTRLSTTFRLELLGEGAGLEAIQEPAREADVDFTDGAARKLVDDLRTMRIQLPDGTIEERPGPTIEPVQLQVVCRRLWENLPREATQIEAADVESVGDVDTALSGYYAERVAAIATETGVRERAVREWFDRSLITEQGFRGQVMQGVDRSGGLKNDAIRRLIDAYLVREEKRRGVTWFELAHDRLIEPVRQDNEAWRKKNLQEWQRGALRWSRQGQPATLLLADKEVKEAERWVERHPDEKLTEDEHSFLDASRKAARLETARRQRRMFLGSVALLVLFAGLTAWALFNAWQARIAWDNADQQRVIAQAASMGAVEQQKTAEAASTVALEQKAIAEAASAKAIEQQKTAEAERISAIDARETLAANLETILTAQVPTATPTPCGPPAGWVLYLFQSGDTLFSLALKAGTSVDALKNANCSAENTMSIGQRLYVPPVLAQPTPTGTLPPSPTPTDTPTTTPTPTPNQAATATVEALQTQLAQVRATQTVVAPIVVEVMVIDGDDDAEERLDTGRMYLYSSDLELTYDYATIEGENSRRGSQIIGIRFQDVQIPPEAKIIKAYMEFVADETNSEPTSLWIYGEATDNAPTFNNEAYNISNRNKTREFVEWDVPAWGTENVRHQTPGLELVVQEIVNRNGWNRGNAIGFLITGIDKESNRRTAKSVNGAAMEGAIDKAPKLYVQYLAVQ